MGEGRERTGRWDGGKGRVGEGEGGGGVAVLQKCMLRHVYLQAGHNTQLQHRVMKG